MNYKTDNTVSITRYWLVEIQKSWTMTSDILCLVEADIWGYPWLFTLSLFYNDSVANLKRLYAIFNTPYRHVLQRCKMIQVPLVLRWSKKTLFISRYCCFETAVKLLFRSFRWERYPRDRFVATFYSSLISNILKIGQKYILKKNKIEKSLF